MAKTVADAQAMSKSNRKQSAAQAAAEAAEAAETRFALAMQELQSSSPPAGSPTPTVRFRKRKKGPEVNAFLTKPDDDQASILRFTRPRSSTTPLPSSSSTAPPAPESALPTLPDDSHNDGTEGQDVTLSDHEKEKENGNDTDTDTHEKKDTVTEAAEANGDQRVNNATGVMISDQTLTPIPNDKVIETKDATMDDAVDPADDPADAHHDVKPPTTSADKVIETKDATMDDADDPADAHHESPPSNGVPAVDAITSTPGPSATTSVVRGSTFEELDQQSEIQLDEVISLTLAAKEQTPSPEWETTLEDFLLKTEQIEELCEQARHHNKRDMYVEQVTAELAEGDEPVEWQFLGQAETWVDDLSDFIVRLVKGDLDKPGSAPSATATVARLFSTLHVCD